LLLAFNLLCFLLLAADEEADLKGWAFAGKNKKVYK